MVINKLFTDALKVSAPKVAFKLVFDDEIISSDNFLTDASLDFICTSFIGQLPSWKLTASWLVVDEFKSYEERELEVRIGAYPLVEGEYLDEPEYISMGFFTVPVGQQKSDDIERKIDIVAYDRVQQLSKKYEPLDFSEVGLSGLDIRTQIAQRNGLDVSNTPMKYDNTIFNSLNIGVGQAITDLEVLKQYYTLNMSFGYVGRSGLLESKTMFNETPQNDGVSADFDFGALKLEKEFGPINSLVYSNKATGDNNAYQSIEASDVDSIELNDIKSLEFSDNIFIDVLTLEEKQLLVDDLFQTINGFSYTPFEIEEFFARPDFDPGDVLTLTNSEGVESLVPITSMSYQYNGGLLGTMATKELPQVLPKNPIPNIYERVTNAEIIVDRLGNRITLEVSDLNSKVTDLGTEVRDNHNQIVIDINGITDRVTTVESNLETNYATIEYSNELTRNAIDGLTNTYSRLGGANLVMNSALYHGLEDDYDHWRGNLVRLSSDTTKSRTAIGLKNGTVYQDIANVQTGWISLRFYVGIQAGLDDGNVQFKINETLYDVVPNNFVELTFEHTQSNIELSFITNMSDKYYISDLMMNYGQGMYLEYQQAQNELHTSSVQISERIRVESNVVNTITYLGANGLEGYNKTTGELVFKQTDTGLEAISIKSGDAEIAGIAITKVGNQTWFTGL